MQTGGKPWKTEIMRLTRKDGYISRKALINELKQCCKTRDLQRGKLLHLIALSSGAHNNIYVATTIITMYSKCGSMQDAQDIFNRMTNRTAIPWNALIFGYVENGDALTALDVFNCMDCPQDRVTFVAAFKACASLPTDSTLDKRACLDRGLSLHKNAQALGFDRDVVVGSTLINMYRKFGDMQRARLVFEGLKERDVVSWTALILGYMESGDSMRALEVFHEMNCAPDLVTFVAALKACACLASEGNVDKQTCLEKGVSIHKHATAIGLHRDSSVANTLVDMYSKCGDMQRACEAFEEMKNRSVVSWNALIFGYMENRKCLLAIETYMSMDCQANHLTFAAVLKACGELGALNLGQRIHDQVCDLGLEQNDMVSTSLVDFYGKCGDMVAAEDVFRRRKSQDTVSWTALMGGYSLLGDTSHVFQIVERMAESGVRLNGVTMQLVLMACSRAGRVEDGKAYFYTMTQKYDIKLTVEHYACMVDMLGRANRLVEALTFVRGMPIKANGVVWKALLGACNKWNDLEVGKVAFEELMELNEDRESVTSACVLMRNMYRRLGILPGVEAEKTKAGKKTEKCDDKGKMHRYAVED